MKAFVAGATGYTGQAVVAQLAAAKHEVWAHVRPDSAKVEDWRARFGAMGAHTDTTPWTLDAMRAQMKSLQPDTVFLLLGTTRARAAAAAKHGQLADYEAIDYGLTALLIDAVAAASSQTKLIYLSSMGVSDSTKNPYLAVRARIEQKLRAGSQPWISARPSFITGHDREDFRPLERIGSKVADGALWLASALGAKRLRARYASMTATQLAAALIRVALDPQQTGILEADTLR